MRNKKLKRGYSALDSINDSEHNKGIVFSKEKLDKLLVNDLSDTQGGRQLLESYSQSEVRDMVENFKTANSQEKLVEISETLYAKSPQYRRLISYYSYMSLFAYVLTPRKYINLLNNEEIEKDYYQVAEFLGNMDIKATFPKILEDAMIRDVFFGYVHVTDNDFHIQKFDNKLCKISSIEKGVFNFSINMSAFSMDEDKLIFYPKEVSDKYNAWKRAKNSKSKNKKVVSDWVELDAENTICIKVNENSIETFPPFAGSFDSIFDIEAFKSLRKNKEELNNYQMVHQKLPMNQSSNEINDFSIDMDFMSYFHNMIVEMSPENVGVVTSPMEIGTIKFERDRVDSDGVARAERDFWSASGTSQALFSTERNTSQGLNLSVKNDEQQVFKMMNQIERWINRLIFFKFKKSNFKINILPVTHFSKKESYDLYLNASTYGKPVKFHLGAVLGVEPIEYSGLVHLENTVFKLHEKLIPLASSHTMSTSDVISGGGDEGGRPESESDEISDEGLRGRDKPDSTL